MSTGSAVGRALRFSRCQPDAQLAETFLHHHVLIIPIIESGHVEGIVTRWDFFTGLAERLRP